MKSTSAKIFGRRSSFTAYLPKMHDMTLKKDVVEGKLVSLGEGVDEEMNEGNIGESATPLNESDASFEEIL